MLLDVCLGTRTSWKILFVICEAPGKGITRREIQQQTRIGNKVLVKFLILLEKFDVIISNKVGRNYTYKLNMSNPFSEKIKELIELERKHLNAPDFATTNILREFTYELTNINLPNLKKIILFGSHAKRTHTTKSDIDVAIILSEKNASDELIITDVINSLNKRFKQEIQPHYFTEKEFAQKKTKLVQEILKDGIQLL